MKRKIILGAVLALILAGSIGLSSYVAITMLKAPSLSSVDPTPDGYLTTVTDDSGNTILTLAGAEANRVYVDLAEIPDDVKNAFIAIEDSRFYQHNGVDFRGILRALVKGITTGHFSQGASTITQQLLKNNVFSGWSSEETFMQKVERKLQEQYLAVRLEKRESKEWILENYLNTINLGGGTWGVQAASRRYFNKNVSDLTLSEAALLAGITKAPETYNPIKNPENAAARRELVLEAMLEQGYISQEDYDLALADPVVERVGEGYASGTNQVFSYFEDALIRQVLQDLIEKCGYREDEAWDAIYRGGLTIVSTQNSDLQSICEDVLSDDAYFSDDEQCSAVMIDVETGAVKAMVGGRGEKDASLTYNRATDSVRQPGSTIKIVGEYAEALEEGKITLGTVLEDAPYEYSNGTEIGNASGTFEGRVTVRNAIASSSNVTALKTFQSCGVDKVVKSIEDFGITTLNSEDRVEALALGGTYNGVTNLEMTAAYNALAAGGTYRKPYYYTQIIDHDGNVLISQVVSAKKVVSPQTASLLTTAMEEVLESGTGQAAYFDGMPLAGKTGTTTDCRDAWMIGYSPYFSLGVWGGYDSNEAQVSSTYVKKIWKAIMLRSHSDYKYKDFTVPENIETVSICAKCGRRAVKGLCDSTVEGNMAYEESFVKGTAPLLSCTCHVRLNVCTKSGLAARIYCPASTVSNKVYLKEAVAGTEEENYVVPKDSEKCTEHTNLLDRFFL